MTNLLITLAMLTASPETPQAAAVRWALAEIESGNRDDVVGASGEVSRYQILPAVWREMDCSPKRAAFSEANGWHVAKRILADRLYFTFVNPDTLQVVPFSPTALYALWHRPARPNRLTRRERDRCRRFANLYEMKLREISANLHQTKKP